VSAHGISHHGAWAERGAFDPLAIPMTGLAALEGTLDAPRYPPYGLLNDVISGSYKSSTQLSYRQWQALAQLISPPASLPLEASVRSAAPRWSPSSRLERAPR
jgi:hypothetical protein